MGMNEADIVSATVRTQETDTVNKVEPEKRQRDSQSRAQEEARRQSDTFERSTGEEPQPESDQDESPPEPDTFERSSGEELQAESDRDKRPAEPERVEGPARVPRRPEDSGDEDRPPEKHIDLKV